MAKSLSQIKSLIEKLRKEEAAIETGVVVRIRKEIAKHGLTIEHLFGTGDAGRIEKSAVAKSKPLAPNGGAKFADSNGNSWSGFGPRPRWLREAVDSGRPLEDFLVAKDSGVGSSTNVVTKKPAKRKDAVRPPKFADDNGNVWHGMGKHPEWIRAAVASGRPLEDFLIGKKRAAAAKKTPPTKAGPVAKVATKVKKMVAVKPAAAKKPAKTNVKSAARSESNPAPAKNAPAAKKAAARKAVVAKVAKPAATPAKKAATKKAAAKAPAAAKPPKAVAKAAPAKKVPSKSAKPASAAVVAPAPPAGSTAAA